VSAETAVTTSGRWVNLARVVQAELTIVDMKATMPTPKDTHRGRGGKQGRRRRRRRRREI